MAKYHQYCPVARAAEIFADRWTPLIMRELLAGSRHFNEIQRGLPGISRSLLVSRLRHLEDGGVVERRAGGRPNFTEYLLTEAGIDLRDVIEHLGAWGVKWAFTEPTAEELDPALLLWKIHQRIDRPELPLGRTVVQFDLTGRKGRRLWLILSQREVSVCLKPPGFDSDLILRADVSLLYRVWLGDIDYQAAVRRGEIVLDGPRELARGLPRWFMWSPMAHFVRTQH
ncbi:MAG: transcriptional regulator [Acidobacteria bacterium]|nr:transcriptional regulator [Acidobacteriota bacterium]